MATGKKSFVAYADWKDVFDQLPNEEAGALIKHIFAYVNDENPKSESVLINAVFANIKNTLKRDLDKWESQLEQRRQAGKKSAQVRSTKSNDRSNSFNEKTRNSTDSVSVSVSVSDNDILLEKETKVDSSPKSPTKQEQIDSFVSWFNRMLLKHKGTEGKFRTMGATDYNNLKKLRRVYNREEFEQAFVAMINNPWVIEKGMATMTHFLINNNFQRYMNVDIEKTTRLSPEDEYARNVMAKIERNKSLENDSK